MSEVAKIDLEFSQAPQSNMAAIKKTPAFLAKIPHEYVCCDKTTKRPRGVNLGWCQLQASHECSSSEFVACFYELKGTNYAVVDIDAKEYDLDGSSLLLLCPIASYWLPLAPSGSYWPLLAPHGS